MILWDPTPHPPKKSFSYLEIDLFSVFFMYGDNNIGYNIKTGFDVFCVPKYVFCCWRQTKGLSFGCTITSFFSIYHFKYQNMRDR